MSVPSERRVRQGHCQPLNRMRGCDHVMPRSLDCVIHVSASRMPLACQTVLQLGLDPSEYDGQLPCMGIAYDRRSWAAVIRGVLVDCGVGVD